MKLCIVHATAAAVALAACGGDFDPPSRVTTTRVLGVRADAPYAAPGETVNLDTLAFDPAGRTVDWGWGTCADPTSTEVTDCIDALDWSTFTVASGAATHSVTLPPDIISRVPQAAQARAAVGVVAVACP